MRVGLLVTTLLIGTAAATAAHAAPPTSGVRALAARCLAERVPGEVRALLDTIPTSADDREQSARAVRRASGCARAALDTTVADMPPLEARGMMAEALLKGRALPDSLPGQGTRRFAAMTAIEIEDSGATMGALLVYDIAGCAIDKDWARARAMFATEPGTAAERDAIMALVPTIRDCAAGRATLSIPPAFARAAMAEELWHRLATPSVAAR